MKRTTNQAAPGGVNLYDPRPAETPQYPDRRFFNLWRVLLSRTEQGRPLHRPLWLGTDPAHPAVALRQPWPVLVLDSDQAATATPGRA